MLKQLFPPKLETAPLNFVKAFRPAKRDVIAEGADMIMKKMRTDLFPEFHYGRPDDISVVRDENMLKAFFLGIVAEAVRKREWSTRQFAYPALMIGAIEATSAWQSFSEGLSRHNHHPILIIDRDVYCFDNNDWHLAKIKIGVGLG